MDRVKKERQREGNWEIGKLGVFSSLQLYPQVLGNERDGFGG